MKIKKIFRLVCLERNNILGDLGMEISELCDNCKHLDYNLVCTAFPNGIPDEILIKGFDHRNPYPGDHGIQFEPLIKK